MTVRVVVADDNALLRAGLITVISSDAELEVIAEADSGPAAVRAVDAHRPDVVLMDIEMPGGGIAATESIVTAHPEVRVLILTMFDLDDYVADALRAGASGFLLKTAEPAALLRAIRDCAAGETTLAPTVVARLIDSFVATPAPVAVPGIAELTDRERQVLCALAAGRSNAAMATELYLAETTVKTHVAHVFTKLGVRDRVQAAVLAHRAGLA